MGGVGGREGGEGRGEVGEANPFSVRMWDSRELCGGVEKRQRVM